jgi:hypothetical protein
LGDPPIQITDFNPGVTHSGLFWTTVVGDDSVEVDLAAGTATLQASDLRMKDYHDFENAILGNGATPTPCAVSFTVRWTATGDVDYRFDNPVQHFRGDFRNAVAQMEWSGRSGVFEFRSAPLAQSTTDGGQLGQESNGSFY